jgi:hypothetical protein
MQVRVVPRCDLNAAALRPRHVEQGATGGGEIEREFTPAQSRCSW